MAKYNVKLGHIRSPEEHRAILAEIDAKHSESSKNGSIKASRSLKVHFNRYSSKPKKKKSRRIYDLNRFVNDKKM